MDHDQAVSGRVARAVPFGLWVAGAVAGIVVLIGLAVRSVNSALAPVAPVVIAITIALLLTALLEPLRRLVQRTGLTQGTSAALTMLIFLLGLTGTFWLTGAQIASGAQDLVDGVSNGLDAVQEWLKTGPLGISGDQIANWIAQGRDWLQSN